MMKRALLTLSLAILGSLSPAWAAPHIVQAEGFAAIVGNDVTKARQAALAEALYDAAGKARMRVQGMGSLSTQGRVSENSNFVVEGLLKGYQIIEDRRDGTRYRIVIEALADIEDESCNDRHHIDLDLRTIDVRIAPGLRGAFKTAALEGIARSVDVLSSSGTFRVTDHRNQMGSNQIPISTLDSDPYATAMSAIVVNDAGYSLSGSLIIERSRADNLMYSDSKLIARLQLQLKDNYSKAHISSIHHEIEVPLNKHIWGTPVLFDQDATLDISPLWRMVADDLDEALKCQPLRAKIISSGRGLVQLSAGQEHGVERGDYFIVQFDRGATPAWQVLKIEQAGPVMSTARIMKPAPSIPNNSLAILLK
jgi:Flagellar assembly protein T, N-terminal domain